MNTLMRHQSARGNESHLQSRGTFVLLVILGSLAAGFVAMLGGCGGGTEIPTGNDVTTALPEADKAILDNSTMQYSALRQSKTADEARADMVTALANTVGVAEARLFQDGHTIFVKFSDGFYGGINTVEGFDEDYESYTLVRPPSATTAKSVLGLGTDGDPTTTSSSVRKGIGKTVGENIKTPGAKKALFMAAGHEDFSNLDTNAAGTGVFDYLKKDLIDQGWSEGDIDLKYNKADDNYTTLRFEDFFNLKDYGIIIIFAHGSCDWQPLEAGNDCSPIEKFYYIQVASNEIEKYYHLKLLHDDFVAQYGTGELDLVHEMQNGRIVTFHHVPDDPTATHSVSYYYLREDLWRERMNGDLPDSFVYLLSCHGWNGQDTFEARKAGCFLGWDNVVTTRPGIMGSNMLYYMVREGLSNRESLNQSTILQQSVYVETNKDNTTSQYIANLHMWPETGSLYAPAWANVVTRYCPSETRTTQVTLTYSDTASGLTDPDMAEDIPGVAKSLKDLVPGQPATIQVKAVDKDGNVLDEISTKVTIEAGENNVTLSFQGKSLSLTASPAQVVANDNATSTITATLVRSTGSDNSTGDPVADQSIVFSTDIGTLVGTNPATTDANGVASIQIRCATAGTATITAQIQIEDLTSTTQVQFTQREWAYAFVSGSPQWDDPDPAFYVSTGVVFWLYCNGEVASWTYESLTAREPYNKSDKSYHHKIDFLDDKMPHVGDEIGIDLVSWGTALQEIGALYVHYQKGGEHYTKKLCDRNTFSGASPGHFSVIID